MRWFSRKKSGPTYAVTLTSSGELIPPRHRPNYPPTPAFEPLTARPRDHAGAAPLRLGGGGLVKVVGESHYQPALHHAASGRMEWNNPIRVVAELVPEPDNPYDRNAVRVDVNGRPVGYLQAVIAGDYQPALLALSSEGRRSWCEGRILGGGKHHYGIHLALDAPAFIRPMNEPGELMVLDARSTVAVTGGRSIQGILEQLATTVGCLRAGSLWAELKPTIAFGGKHADGTLLTVSVDGLEIGSLSPAMSLRYLNPITAVMSANLRPGCLVHLDRGEAAWTMHARLPDADIEA